MQLINYFKYAWHDFKRQQQVKKRYYHDVFFSRIDRTLFGAYFFLSPYQVSKHYQKRRREKDIHVYGETPLTTLEKIGQECHLTSQDHLLELGCGRGRGAFFFRHFFQCRVTGVERIPHFVKLANHIAKKYQVQDISFECVDMLQTESLSQATIIYLYGTCLKDLEITQLIERFKQCQKQARIVTISYPLKDYDTENIFQLEKSFSVSFPWGETEAYLQTMR